MPATPGSEIGLRATYPGASTVSSGFARSSRHLVGAKEQLQHRTFIGFMLNCISPQHEIRRITDLTGTRDTSSSGPRRIRRLVQISSSSRGNRETKDIHNEIRQSGARLRKSGSGCEQVARRSSKYRYRSHERHIPTQPELVAPRVGRLVHRKVENTTLGRPHRGPEVNLRPPVQRHGL